MTDERRTDPVTGEPVADDTRVVERQTYVERERPVADPGYVPPERPVAAAGYVPPERPVADPGYVPPAQPAGSQVNVSSGPAYVADAPGPMFYVRRVVSLLFGILAVLIGLRVLLLLLVANQQNSIVDFVYNVTEPFVAPFRGIFNFDTVSPGGGSVLDVAAVVALIGWLLIYVLLMAILRLGDRRAAV